MVIGTRKAIMKGGDYGILPLHQIHFDDSNGQQKSQKTSTLINLKSKVLSL